MASQEGLSSTKIIIVSLQNMDYGQLSDEMHFCDRKLVCQIHISFVYLSAALIKFNVCNSDLMFV
jgi:hypothetical protein